MKGILKRYLPIISVISLALTMSAYAAAANGDLDPPLREMTEKEYIAAELEETGGTPGALNVMLNGAFIDFTGALPEMSDGSVCVPFRAFFETLGANVGYDAEDNRLNASFYNRTVALTPGIAEMTVTEAKTPQVYDLAVAPYVKSGVSYIPVRSVAEALGYDVFWDGAHESVVIIDLRSIIADIDKGFSSANSLMNMPLRLYNTEGVFKTAMNISAEVTRFDSIRGDTVTPAAAELTAISDGKSFSVTAKLDASEIVGLLIAELYYYSEPPEIASALEKSLENAEAELIFNYDEDTLYVNAPFLNAIDSSFPDGAWIKISGATGYLETLGIANESDLELVRGTFSLADILGKDSVGALICEDAGYYREYDQIFLYAELAETAAEYRQLLGDANFSKGATTYSFSLPWGKYLETLEGYELYSAPGEEDFRLNAVIKTDGESVTGLSLDYYMLEDGYSTILYDCDLTMSRSALDMRLELHSKNHMKAVLKIDSKTDRSAAAVPEAPPAAEKVVELKDIYSGGVSGVLKTITGLAMPALTA